MTKSPSADTRQGRYYHSRFDGGDCLCVAGDYKPSCRYTFPSVTTILQKALPKEALIGWAARMAAELAVEELGNIVTMTMHEGPDAAKQYIGNNWRRHRDAAGERGTAVHAAAETGAAIEDVSENARARTLAWHRWLDDHQPEIVHQEGTVYSPQEGYAGTFDLIADINGATWLIDIKTGGVYWDHRLQQAAYRNAYFMGDDDGQPIADVPHIDHVGILQLADDGYSFFEIKVGDDEWDAFRTAIRMYRYIDRLSKEKPRLVREGKLPAEAA